MVYMMKMKVTIPKVSKVVDGRMVARSRASIQELGIIISINALTSCLHDTIDLSRLTYVNESLVKISRSLATPFA